MAINNIIKIQGLGEGGCNTTPYVYFISYPFFRMRLETSSDLHWQNQEGTQHQLRCDMDLRFGEIFTSENPARELETRSSQVRDHVFRLFLETHMPQMLADTGIAPEVEGSLRTQVNTHWQSNWAIHEGERPGINAELGSALKMDVAIATDRPVHAIQALAANRAAVADAVAEHVMGALKHRYLGIASTQSETESRVRGDEVEEYRVREILPETATN